MEEDSGFPHHGIALKAKVLCCFVMFFGVISNWYCWVFVELNLSSVEVIILAKIFFFFFARQLKELLANYFFVRTYFET